MDYREADSDRGDGGDQQHVLYVDDSDGVDRTVDRLADRLGEDVTIRTVDGNDPRTALEARQWSCLVVGDGFDSGDRAALLSAAACPTVLFTSDDPASVSQTVLEQVDTLVERGNGDRSTGFLAEKIKTLLASSTNSVEDALSEALATVEAQSNGTTALFVVDAAGEVVWSNRSFEATFPTETADTSTTEIDDFDAVLDAVVRDIPEATKLVELDGTTEADDNRSIVVPTAERSRFYLHDQYDLSTLGSGLTIEQFEDVTDRVRREARSQLLELLVEQSQDGLYTLDHNGVIDFCNESFAANLGYDRSELIGEHASKTLAPGELESGQETVQHLLDNPDQDSIEIDMTFLTYSGEHREMSIHYTLLPTDDDSYGGLMGVVRDVTERKRRERELRESRERLRTVVQNLPVVLFVLDPDGTITFADGAGLSEAPWGLDQLVGLSVEDIGREYPDIAAEIRRALDGEQVDVVHEIEGQAYHTTYQPVVEDGELLEVIGVTMDVTERRERERRIEAQRDELSTLNRTNELIQEIISALGSATTRSELQQIVCDRLVESDLYELAWVGERQGAGDIIVPLTSAGTATEFLDGIEILVEQDETGRGPGGTAYQTGTVQIVPDIYTDDRLAPYRDRAAEAGLESLIAVPLRHGETTHSILTVYATEPDAFSERIAEGFAVLGETIGLALTAIQNKQLLQRDTTLVLEFQSRSDEASLVPVAQACDCRLETAGAVETDEGAIQYLRVDGATPQAVVDAIETEYGTEARVTRTEGDRIIEIHDTSALGVRLSDVGARLETATARPDGVRIVVEASADADVRTIRDVIERDNPAIELTAKTERGQPRSDDTVPSPLSELTDRQREVLQAAYLSGYYDWPREQTAEEVADSLDIASPTLHQHLRRAERTLLDRLFDG